MSRARAALLTAACVAVVTLFAFLPALNNGFVNWDDAANFLNNPHYRGVSPSRLRWMFTSFHLGIYIPLSWMTLGLDYVMWGMNPRGYHLTNVLLHGANAVLFFFIMIEFFKAAGPADGRGRNNVLWASAFGALFFSLHPLRVESVAWITERRDVLSGAFFLTTVLLFIAGRSSPPGRARTMRRFSYLTYVLALGSKASGMTLPLLLIVLDGALSRAAFGEMFSRKTLAAVKNLWPYFILTVPFAVLAVYGQNQSRALAPVELLSLPARLAVAAHGLLFYLMKTAWPFGLSPFYDIPEPILLISPARASLMILACAAAFWLLIKTSPAVWPAVVWYVLALLPNSGIFQSGFQMAADRYTYLPAMSWAALAAAVFLRISRKPALARAGAAALVICFMLLTRRQITVWRDSHALWRHALRVAPDSAMAHTMLGRALVDQGRPSEAIGHFERALNNPFTSLSAHNNLGAALASEGRLKEALPHFRYVLEHDPGDGNARRNYERASELLRSPHRR